MQERGVPTGTRATEDAADRRFAASPRVLRARRPTGTLQDLDEAPALVRDLGRDSITRTTSPAFASLASSWAWIVAERRTTFS